MKHGRASLAILVSLVLPLLLAAPGARADEDASPRRVAIPSSGLTLEVPQAWTIEQYGPAVLRVRKGQATLWFYAAEGADEGSGRHLRRLAEQAAAEAPDAPAPQPRRWAVEGAPGAMQLWFAQEDRARFHGVVPTSGGGLYAEADLPADDPDLRAALEGVLASVDATPYVHPERHVDWTLGFTIDAAGDGWRRQREDDGRIRITPAEKAGVVVIERQGPTVAGATAAGRLEGLVEAMRRRLAASGREAVVALDGAPAEAVLGAGTKAVGAPVRITLGTSVAMKGHVFVAERFALSAVAGASDEAALEHVLGLARTFRVGTHPGKRAERASAPRRFEREDAPPVSFTLPAGWVLTKPRTSMHAGHFKPDAESSLEGSAYYFGAGAGGGLEANLLRWKSQMSDATATAEETLAIAPEIEATVLDIVGRYGTHARAPAGHPPGPAPAGKPGQRMIAVFMSCPKGPLYFKLVGPKDEVEQVRPAFVAWLRSFRVVP